MFDVDRFIAECRGASAANGSPGVLEVVASAVAAPSEILKALGEPRRAGLHVVFRSPDLTILNVVWGPRMCQLPHNHKMWAVIGMYTGREDNIFWRRVASAPDGRIEAAGARALCDRDAAPLGHDVIHSVVNPIKRLTGAIHVYGGDFFAVPRSEWDPERLVEQAFDVEKALALFEESNRLYPAPGEPARMNPVDLGAKLATFSERWQPRTIGQFNGHDLMVVKAQGEFVWHKHDDTDDFFLVLKGHLTIELRDRSVELGPGELFVVPKGVEHRPVAKEEVHILLIEPAGTPNTGDPATAAARRVI